MINTRSSDVLDLLNRIELRYPVTEWRVDGIRIWPLLRVRLYTDILAHGLMGQSPSSMQQISRTSMRMVKAVCKASFAWLHDKRSNAVVRDQVDAVFLSDGVSFAKAGGKWFEKFYDPIILWLEREGLRYALLTPMAEALWPRRTASQFIQPDLDRVNVAASIAFAFRKHRVKLELDGIAEMFEEIRISTPGAEAYAERKAIGLAVRLQALAAYFERALTRVRPRRAFVNTYYSLEGMAFVLACRRARVCVADVQHGVQGERHVAYGRWRNIPAGGWELLPNEFWVWTETESSAIDQWRPHHDHRPVVVGNLWLSLWLDADEQFVHDEVRLVHAAAGRVRASKHVLVSLQWGLPEEEVTKILHAIIMCPREFHWWLRLHPLMAQQQGRFIMLVRGLGIVNCDIDLATTTPLPALLRVVDVNVTHSSSTVIEAGVFGVPSVVTSDFGAEIFASEISGGTVTVALHTADIARAVCAATRRAGAASETTAKKRVQSVLAAAFHSTDPAPAAARLETAS